MEKYIVVKTRAELNTLPAFKKVEGLFVYCAEDDRLYKLVGGSDFIVFDNIKKYSFIADNFINLTVFHNLNTPHVNVLAYDYDKGEHVKLDWKLGTGFGKVYEVIDGYNALTITASNIVTSHIYITIIEVDNVGIVPEPLPEETIPFHNYANKAIEYKINDNETIYVINPSETLDIQKPTTITLRAVETLPFFGLVNQTNAVRQNVDGTYQITTTFITWNVPSDSTLLNIAGLP